MRSACSTVRSLLGGCTVTRKVTLPRSSKLALLPRGKHLIEMARLSANKETFLIWTRRNPRALLCGGRPVAVDHLTFLIWNHLPYMATPPYMAAVHGLPYMAGVQSQSITVDRQALIKSN